MTDTETPIQSIDDLLQIPKRGEKIPTLPKLLDALKKEDPLFNYHVPIVTQTNSTDEELLEYLDGVYTRGQFIITDAENIKKYIKSSDLVVSKRDIQFLAGSIVKESYGKLHSFIGYRNSAKVDFEHMPILVDIPHGELHTKAFFRDNIRLATPDTAKANDLVQYVGEDRKIIDPRFFVPKGLAGVVYNITRDDKYNLQVAWMNAPGLVLEKKYAVSAEDVELVKKNFIDYAGLKDSCLK